MLYDFRTLTGMSGKFGNKSQRVVTKYVRIYCAKSLQTILEAMQHCWTFAIALDGGHKSSVPYLDYRLRFVLVQKSFNVHMIAFSMNKSQTGEIMFKKSSFVAQPMERQTWQDVMLD
jgi:hypothetical protein